MLLVDSMQHDWVMGAAPSVSAGQPAHTASLFAWIPQSGDLGSCLISWHSSPTKVHLNPMHPSIYCPAFTTSEAHPCLGRLFCRNSERSGELFGVAPVPPGQAHIAVEQAADSSRK